MRPGFIIFCRFSLAFIVNVYYNIQANSMETTIKHIAQITKVSYATVSRALNNKKGVKAETRTLVLSAAKKLNYQPNAIARGLVKKETYSVGLVIPDITNPFFPEVARGIEDQANEAGYSIFLCNTNWEDSREIRSIRVLTEKRVDGIIIAPTASRLDFLEEILPRGMPVVFVSSAAKNSAHSSVVIDNILGGFLATSHLIEAGYRDIGFIGAPNDSLTLDERLEGYKMALRKHNLIINDDFIQLGDFRRETGYNIIKRMVGEGEYPRAVFAENDLLALGVIQGARELGLLVPEDVAVVGFDDIPFAAFPEIQLTTICQPKHDMGKIAFDLLLERMTDKESGIRKKRIILEPELVVRRSSC